MYLLSTSILMSNSSGLSYFFGGFIAACSMISRQANDIASSSPCTFYYLKCKKQKSLLTQINSFIYKNFISLSWLI